MTLREAAEKVVRIAEGEEYDLLHVFDAIGELKAALKSKVPEGAIEVEPGLFVFPHIKSAFVAAVSKCRKCGVQETDDNYWDGPKFSECYECDPDGKSERT